MIEVMSLGDLCLRANTSGARGSGLSVGKCRMRAHRNHTDPQITAAEEWLTWSPLHSTSSCLKEIVAGDI